MCKKENGFVEEFKKFITRGNVVDLAVGVVIGGAFTAIVNTLVNKVLTPIINFVIYLLSGKTDGHFSGLDIILIPAKTEIVNGETLIVKEATILGLSDLLSAVLNFFLIALVLFLFVKAINKIREENEKAKEKVLKKIKEKKNKTVEKEEEKEE